MTLLELLVVVALLGVLYSVVHLAVPRGEVEVDAFMRALLDARREALIERKAVSRVVNSDGRSIWLTAFPNGLVLADSGRGTFAALGATDDGAP